MTNYGDFDPSSSISIEGTSHDFHHQHHHPRQHQQQQQQNQNWILLNKHETLADQISSKRILYHKPLLLSSPSTSQATDFVHRPTRNALQRMESVNRLNDRIRRKLESSNNNDIYASTSIFDDYIHPKQIHQQPIKEEDGSLDDRTNIPSETSNRRADRVVDDSFRFISDESGGRGTRLPTPYDNENRGFDSNGNNIDRRHLSSQIKKPSNFLRYQSQVAAAAAQQQQQQQQQYPRSQQHQPIRLREHSHPHHRHHHHKQYPRSLTDPLLTTTTTKNYSSSHHHPQSNEIIFDDTQSQPQQQQQQQQKPSTSRGDDGEIFYDDEKNDENFRGDFLPPTSTPTKSHHSHHQIHNIPIKMIRRRADSLDSGSLRLNGNFSSSNKFERDPHPTPLTASDWQTPAISRRQSISHRKRDSFVDPRRPIFKSRRHPSFNDPRYEPPTRRISQNIPFQQRQQQLQLQQPYRRQSRLPRKTPSLLRRDSYYYKKCDICLNEIRPDGLPCYACNSVNTYRNNPRMTRRISRSEYLQSKNINVPLRKKPNRIPSTSAAAGGGGARLPTQPPPPPPVTIEPYFEQVNEESGETSSNSSAVIQDQGVQVQTRQYPSSGWPASATIPPRTPSQNDFFRDQRFRFSTSPRRQLSNRGILNAEGLQKHPSYLGYRKAPNIPAISSTYIPHRAQPSPNQQSRQSTVIWPSNAGPAWKSIDPRSRVNPSPVFRYGKQVPKWLYDYDAYAEEQRHKELKQRRRKVFAIITVFLLFALVVAAGVVLAAVN